MINRVGQRFGDYRLIRFLGEGTFGDVYFGEQVYDQSPAAVKVFKAKLTQDKFKDFINEARTVLLRHPNIVQVLDFGIEENDIPFLVMEFAPSGTLLQHHPRGTRLPLPTVVNYVKQIAAALQYAHDQRRIHRDVKPENILFGAKDELLLSDFGIAVVAHNTHSQRTEEAIGTALYMAPEQWQGKPVPATDQYALGIIVYEWLCGECPFQGSSWELMNQHFHDPPPLIRAKVSALSPAVEQVILRALEKDPMRRFVRIGDFVTALQKASFAFSSTQAPIKPLTPPTQKPIPPTVPAWLTRRDTGGAATGLPLPTRQVTQPGQTLLPSRLTPTDPVPPSMSRKSWPHAPARRPLLRNIGVLLSILINALETLAQKFGYLGNRGVLLVILILVIGLPGYFAFRNDIPNPLIGINSNFSSNASDLTQPPITTVLINETVRFSGVDITITTAQQSMAFLDDTNAGAVGVVRANLKEVNTSTSNARYNYFDEAHLILPDNTSVALFNAQNSSGPDAGVLRINWLDFQVPESVQINQLTLQLGRDTKTQEMIPLKGKKV